MNDRIAQKKGATMQGHKIKIVQIDSQEVYNIKSTLC